MGRAFERLGYRRHRLYPLAEELANATQAMGNNDPDALAAPLHDKLDTVAADAFEDALSIAALELRQRTKTDEAVQLLVSTTLEVAECGQREAGGFTARLFGTVLRFVDQADVPKALSEGRLDAVVQSMVRHRLLETQASVVLLPRLLPPSQAQVLLAGDVHALRRKLLNGDAIGARRVAERRVPPLPRARPPGEIRGGAVALLVGVASASNGRAFPLGEQLAAQARLGTSQKLLIAAGYLPPHLLNDMNRALADFSAEVGPTLGQGAVRAVQPPIAFAQASMYASHLERSDSALVELQHVAQKDAGGRMDLLTVGQPAISEQGLMVPVFRRTGGGPVTLFCWPVSRYEPPRDAMIQMLSFLHAHGVELERDRSVATAGPLH
ncbi:hypothetical protein [Pseudorhodoferax sp. Leaf265]|uniref:hypothetical protein n=1 Tax=Pseudorhodoferax sp. Leaf265 TaxID=1736315 RepID=UPI0012E78947|nr:hypothetical protein [Pseudorhodoferax sp. Leaf265]